MTNTKTTPSKFFYSEMMGMTQVPDNSPLGSSSEIEAIMKFYTTHRRRLQDKIVNHQRAIDVVSADLKALDDKYRYIKDEYPEEFL